MCRVLETLALAERNIFNLGLRQHSGNLTAFRHVRVVFFQPTTNKWILKQRYDDQKSFSSSSFVIPIAIVDTSQLSSATCDTASCMRRDTILRIRLSVDIKFPVILMMVL